MIMTIPARIIWTTPWITWFSAITGGSGKPAIICPIDTYIRIARNTIDVSSRRFSTGVS